MFYTLRNPLLFKLWSALIFVQFFALGAKARGEDFKLTDGKTISGVVKRADPDGLMIETDSGVEKIEFIALGDEVQKRFHFDYAKAEAYRAQRRGAREAALGQQIAAVQARAAALDAKIAALPTAEQSAKLLAIEQTGFKATAQIERGVTGSVFASLSRKTGRAAATLLDRDTRRVTSLGQGFIYGLEGAAGEEWTGALFPCGYYHYRDEFGQEQTVRAYATSAAGALVHGAGQTIAETLPVAGTTPPPRKNLPGNLRGDTLLDR